MAVMLLHLFGVPWSELNRFRYHPNTGVTIVDIPARGKPRLRLIRDVSHLPPELRPKKIGPPRIRSGKEKA
jgi:hypothetical protein